MAREGRGVALDASRAAILDGKAIELLAQRCDDHDEEVACFDAARLIRAHYRDAGARGRKLLARACQLGHKRACEEVKRRRKKRGGMYDL
jgi:hypothetical protein